MSYSFSSYSHKSLRKDTPTDIDASTQTSQLVNSIIYDESMVTDEDIVGDTGELSEEEDEDEENKPPYLKRNKNKDEENTNDRQRQMTQALLRGSTTFANVPLQEKKWHPNLAKKLDYNDWRKPNIDKIYGTFYSYKPETIAEPEELPVLPSTHREPAEGHLFGGVDFFHMREKSYINKVRQVVPSPYRGRSEHKRFSQHIIQEYRRPLKDLKPNGYGYPKSVVLQQNYDDVNDVIESFIHPNTGYNVMPRSQNPEKCDRPNVIACEFCDVLGPGSCAMCIEATNRRIAHDVEEAAFPALDCSASSLVAPSLSRVMYSFDRKMKKTNNDMFIAKNPMKMKTTFALPAIVAQRTPTVSKKKNQNGKVSGILKNSKTQRLILPAISPIRSPTKDQSIGRMNMHNQSLTKDQSVGRLRLENRNGLRKPLQEISIS